MKMIKELLDGASALGACRKTDGIDTLDKLVELYTSPQGREFCAKHNYPSREQWNRIAEHWSKDELRKRHIYIDEAEAKSDYNPGTVVAVGASTYLHITAAEADEVQHIIALHGANITVCAERYAVFEAVTDSTSPEILITKDETAIQL